MSPLNIQLPDSLYKSLQKLAQQDGVSLDQFVVLAIAEKISALITEGYLTERANRGNRSKYEDILAKVPDIEPDSYDQLPPVNMEYPQGNDSKFIVEKSEISFRTLLAKPYISEGLRKELLKSDILLLPQENFREGVETVFPTGTDEIFSYIRENTPEEICTDILIEDEDYKEIALFSDLIVMLGSFMVTSIAAPLLVNLLSDYLNKKRLPEKAADQIKIEILIANDKETKRLSYEGSVSNFRKTVYPVAESLSLESNELEN